jgi:hypothetical protein
MAHQKLPGERPPTASKGVEDPGLEAQSVFGSTLKRFRRVGEHFMGGDPQDVAGQTVDPIELWGRRIGRMLSLLACVGLCIYLFFTYVR